MSNTRQDRSTVAGKMLHEVKTVQAAMRGAGIKVSAATIRQFIIAWGHSRAELYALLRIHNEAKGLTYMSEGDSPFEVVSFKKFDGSETIAEEVGGPVDWVQEASFEYFFKNRPELRGLHSTLRDLLDDVRVYRIGEVQIDVFVIGRLPNGEHGGVRTKAIET